MKKLALLFLPLLLVGAGCATSQNQEVADQSWHLTFELPEGWVETTAYNDGDVRNAEKELTKELGDIYIQSTNKTVLRGGAAAGEIETLSEEQIESENYSLIHAFALSQRRAIPSEAEDLGNGFYKVQVCSEGEECEQYGGTLYDYYLKGENANYQFKVYERGNGENQSESVILSATEVK